MRFRLRLQFTSVQVYVCCCDLGIGRVGLGTPSPPGGILGVTCFE
jgi:hypothetical protein